MKTIQATVNARLLHKASRLFTGTIEGRIIELLQNARRAGATEVQITNAPGTVTVQDNGRGLDDVARLLDLGSSGWDPALEASEDPAGVGLFCLAPRRVHVRSRGQSLQIDADGWTGRPIAIETDENPINGAWLQFEDEPWTHALVQPLAVFTGLRVIVDGEPCAQQPFLTGEAVELPELGWGRGSATGAS